MLLVGHPHDPFTQHIRTAALAAGATLGWIAGAEALAQALQQVRPAVLAIDAATTSAITAQIADGRIEGRVWHAHPTAVIEAVAAIATRDSPPRGARRRASAITQLRPWFGGELTQLLVAESGSAVLLAVCEALDLDVDLEQVTGLVAAELPQPTRRRAKALVHLPQRSPSPVDPAFAALARHDDPALEEVLEDTVEVDDDRPLASLRPLILGDSMLDRVLAEQAAARRHLSGATT